MKNKVVFSLSAILLLVTVFFLNSVIDNYTTQTPNDLLVFQRIMQKGQKTTEEIENKPTFEFEYADIEDVEVNDDNTLRVILLNGQVYDMTYEELMNLTQNNYYNQYIIDQLGQRVKKYAAIKQQLTELTFSDFKDYTEIYPDIADAGIYAALDKTTVKDVEVMPLLVNENYLKNLGVKLEGEGITQAMIDKCQRKAVVTRSFAEEHFYGETYLGKTFKMNEKRYQISGIIDDKKDTLNSFFSDGSEKIYIPYTVNKKNWDIKLDYLSAVKGTKCERLLKKAVFLNLERVDYTVKNPSVKAIGSAVMFLFGLIASVYLFKLWIFTAKCLKKSVGDGFDKYYLGGVLKHRAFTILFEVLSVIAIPLAILAVLYTSIYDFQVVRYYLDNENLFSLSAIFTNLSSVLAKESSFAFAGDVCRINMYNNSLLFEFMLALVICPLAGLWLYSFGIISKTNRAFAEFATVIMFWIAFVALTVWLVYEQSPVFFVCTAFVTVAMMIKKKICK